MLGLGVVDGHHGAGENARLLPGVEAVDAGGGLLTAAHEPLAVGGALVAQQGDEVAAVVHDEVGTALQGLHQQVLVALHVHAVDAEGLHAQISHGSGHVILGGQGVAAGEIHLGAALPQHQTQVGGLGLQVDRDGDGEALKGLFSAEALLNAAEGGHEVPHPLDLLMARGGQGHILDNTHDGTPSSQQNPGRTGRSGNNLSHYITKIPSREGGGGRSGNVYTFVMDFFLQNGYNAQ